MSFQKKTREGEKREGHHCGKRVGQFMQLLFYLVISLNARQPKRYFHSSKKCAILFIDSEGKLQKTAIIYENSGVM